MRSFLLNILLAFNWVLLYGEINAKTFFEGFFISFFLLYLAKDIFNDDKYFSKIINWMKFLFYFIKELIKANLIVGYDIITPKDYMQPAILAIPLDAKTDIEITLLANFITLTPGTLSLDISDDRKTLYIHAMYVDNPDKFKLEIKNGIEKKLLEALR
jgi:multicomponent Na+:H+ antiporter subunit E